MANSWVDKLSNWRRNEGLKSRLTEWVLSAFVILLPFQWKFPPISLMMMLMGLVFFFFLNRSYISQLKRNKRLHLLLAYYVWVGIGLFYTTHPKEGGADFLVQIALAAWPIGIVGLNAVNSAMIQRLTLLFTRALGVSILACMAIALYAYSADGDTQHFFYNELAAWPLVPQHYLSMYVTFGIVILIVRWLQAGKSLTSFQKIEFGFWIGLFLLAQALLSVRNQFLALPIALLPVAFFSVQARKLSKKHVLKVFGISFSLLIVIALLPGTQRRIIETYHELRSIQKVVDNKQTNHRVYLWKYAIETISEKPWLGTGTGGGNAALRENLKNCDAKFWDGEKNYYLYQKEYNAHNVFLQAWMTHGVIGLALILGILFLPIRKAYKEKDSLILGFLLLAIISFTTESMLERQAGVLWFAVFYTLLVVAPKKEVIAANMNTPANRSK